MTPPPRTAALALLALAGLGALWPASRDTRAAPPAPVFRTAQPPLTLPGPLAPPAVVPEPPETCLPAPPPVLVSPVDPPAPVVAIRVRVAAVSLPQQEIEYRLCVHNTSPAAAHHVLVRNPVPANTRFVRAAPAPSAREPELQWHLDTLPAGACREITLVLAPTDESDVKNCARVQFEHGQCVVTRIARAAPPAPAPMPVPVAPAPEVPPMPPADKGEPPTATAARLLLTMTGPKKQYANLPARYLLTVSNPGKDAATNVQIANPIPQGAKLVGTSPGGRVHEGQVAWNLGILAAGERRTVQITLAAKAGKMCNRATALADGGLKADAEACTMFEGVSAMTLELVDTKDPVPVGGQTSYRIVVKNQGSAAVTNVKLTAVVPPELKLLRATGKSEPPPRDKLPEPAADGQALPYAPLKALAPGEEAVYEVSVEAVRAGDARFKVELMADQLQAGGPVREQESTFIIAPADDKK